MMETEEKASGVSRALDWVITGAMGALALVVYFATMARYVYPGESAKLTAVWRGFDTMDGAGYPLMGFFARLTGASNALAPILGAVAVVLVYALVRHFLKERIGGENTNAFQLGASRIGAAIAAVTFMFTPAVHEAATHLEPRLFDFTWAAALFALLLLLAKLPVGVSWLVPVAAGFLAGFGLVDSPLFLCLLPLYLVAAWVLAVKGKTNQYIAVSSFFFAMVAGFVTLALCVEADFGTIVGSLGGALKDYIEPEGWILILVFATVPFVLSLFASRRGLSDDGGWAQWAFHAALTFAAILAIATPLSPSHLLEPYAILPVSTSAFAAVVAGYLATYWYLQIRTDMRLYESEGASVVSKISRPIGLVFGGILSIVLVFTILINFIAFDSDRGAFADRIAKKVLAELGDRTWFITDGTLDNHLRIAACESGAKLNLVCLQRDLEKKYLDELSALVKAEKLGGDRNPELLLSLSLGVLPFVQDWFAADADAGKRAAIWGASDLWYGSGVKPVPELLFFGADPARVPDWNAWKAEYNETLPAPEGWGSFRLSRNRNPVEKMKLELRRHLGLVANNRGVYLQDEKRPEEAFAMYELVLNDIDADNVCALFNEFELAREGEKGAVAKKNDIEKALKRVVDDKERRFRLFALGNYYGYIRNPDILIRLGYTWARSGRAGEALQQIRRAIDFIPTEKRSALMNMMAALYASESSSKKSRETYLQVLDQDATNHDALIGLYRLALVDGDNAKAKEYLERATEAAGDDPRAVIEKAMLAMMTGDLVEAKSLLRRATDADHGNLQAWSLYAAVTMQQIDASKDEAEKKALTKELEGTVLPTMEKQSRDSNDYYVQTTRAFILMRQGAEKRREARDAFIAASKNRPDIAATSDIVLGLDISLNDTVDAERHARDVLRRNRKAPLANYVMGSLALQRGEFTEAEAFLRRAAEAEKPVVLALNDLAEVLRRSHRLGDAEIYARKAIETDPRLYVAYETLGSIILERGGDLDEAEKLILKACELSKDEKGRDADVRMLISLARVQAKKGDATHAKVTVRKVRARQNELSEYERSEFEEFARSLK